MRKWQTACIVSALCAAGAFAGTIENGVLMVDGRPFYPLGSWNSSYTTAQDIARLGMNTSFQGGPSTEAAVESFRGFMRECNDLGIQVVPYLSYGGAGVTPWPPDSVRAISKLASEPNLLCWYVGDDIGMQHLPGIEQTVTILREETPSIPTVADYIAKETPEAKTTFTQFIDIRCQYAYPVPNQPLSEYLTFFDQQREFVGDPLWTWVQNFMWGSTGRMLDVGAEGPGPIPDPEQVRLMAFAAINRGVRGLLFFPHHGLHRLPEVAAEVALTCHEIRLVDEHLAAGTTSLNLAASDPDVNAAAFRLGSSTVISAALYRPFYHQWVDEALVENVTITCPWPGPELPTALMVATPDVVECAVEYAVETSQIRVTLPSMELAAFILLSYDDAELAALREGVQAIPEALRTLVVPAAASQAKKVNSVVWQLGIDNLYAPSVVMDSMRAVERCAAEIDARRFDEATRAWRDAMRACRTVVHTTMEFADERRDVIPPQTERFLISPYGLHKVRGFAQAPDPDDPWHFARKWMITGPFPLEWDGVESDQIPAGFDRVYPPETSTGVNEVFSTVDGRTVWRFVEADMSGLLDFHPHFATTENMVCYARCRVTAPRDMDVTLSLGSNDGARMWLNGEDVFVWCSVPVGGRGSAPHQNEIPVRLKAGVNTILVKVENLGNDWHLYLSAHDPDRELEFDFE